MGSTPWTLSAPSKALLWGHYSAPQTPSWQGQWPLHVVPGTTSSLTQQTFSGGGGVGSHEIYTNREGGSTIFLLLPREIKNLTKSLIPFPPPPPLPPRELKNDNSLRTMPITANKTRTPTFKEMNFWQVNIEALVASNFGHFQWNYCDPHDAYLKIPKLAKITRNRWRHQ